MRFDVNGCCHEIVHNPSDTVIKVPLTCTITTSFVLRDNWSDQAAYVEAEAMPKNFIINIWKAATDDRTTGPFAYQHYSGGRCRAFNQKVDFAYTEWEAYEKHKSIGSVEPAPITEMKDEKQKAKLDKVRSMAAEAVKRRKFERVVLFDEADMDYVPSDAEEEVLDPLADEDI